MRLRIFNSVIMFLLMLVFFPERPQAATLLVTNTNDSGTGSFRSTIDNANTHSGLDTIKFAIPGGGVHTIQPLSALPTITDPVVIDGYTQPGASPNTNPVGSGLNTVLMIELDGGNAGDNVDGLHITAGNSQTCRDQ